MAHYIGRFAPSPTGRLHAGSLAAALASACDAYLHDGHWLLRIEDIDPPRVVQGSAFSIITTLNALGFRWHGEIVFQSARDQAYLATFARLAARGLIYACTCSRTEVAAHSHRRTADGEPIYSGTCAHGLPDGRAARAWRMRMPDQDITFHDRWEGLQRENPARDTGDIILRRADGLWAYQLAVVVDDSEAGVTDIVRGADLLHSTARQIALYQALELPAPNYLHVPLVRNDQGEKLSKQTLAPSINTNDPLSALEAAATHLGLDIPAVRTLAEFWRLAPIAWERALTQRIAELATIPGGTSTVD